MKKIHLLASLFLGMALFTSCETDRDDNPVLSYPESFQLYAPGAAQNNVIDLLASNTLTLSCDQPNYGGMPMATTYEVQIALDEAFAEGQYAVLPTTFRSATLAVKTKELNEQMIELYKTVNTATEYPEGARPLFVRVRAFLTTTNSGSVLSNVVQLPQVLATYKASDVSIPENLFICGSNIGTAWNTWLQLAPVFGIDNEKYTVINVPEGGMGFKFGVKEQDWNGHSAVVNIDDQAGAGVSADGDDNIHLDKAGWYTIVYSMKIRSSVVQYTLTIVPAEVFTTGNATANWDGTAMTAPTTKDGYWVSEPFTGNDEMRAFVKVPGRDWWRTEFTLKNGTEVFFRSQDIPNNWEESFGAEYSVKAKAGQRLYVSFDSASGKVE